MITDWAASSLAMSCHITVRVLHSVNFIAINAGIIAQLNPNCYSTGVEEPYIQVASASAMSAVSAAFVGVTLF